MATIDLDESAIRVLIRQCAVQITEGCSCPSTVPTHMTKTELLEKLKWAYSIAEQLPDTKE